MTSHSEYMHLRGLCDLHRSVKFYCVHGFKSYSLSLSTMILQRFLGVHGVSQHADDNGEALLCTAWMLMLKKLISTRNVSREHDVLAAMGCVMRCLCCGIRICVFGNRQLIKLASKWHWLHIACVGQDGDVWNVLVVFVTIVAVFVDWLDISVTSNLHYLVGGTLLSESFCTRCFLALWFVSPLSHGSPTASLLR
mgnify:CR=1 FL=1